MKPILYKFYLPTVLIMLLVNCRGEGNRKELNENLKQSDIRNQKLRNYSFLMEMYADSYFPSHLVDKGKLILIDLCIKIESQKPKDLGELYALTHHATEMFNDLEDEFFQNGSEIETAARECIAKDIEAISLTYGFKADNEELIAPRNW